jgi:hypothetical protein
MSSFGRNIKVGMAKEATYNAAWAAPGATTGTWIHIESFEFEPISQDIRASFATGEVMPKLTEFGRGVRDVKGSFTMFANKQQLNWIFLNLFGNVTTTVVGAPTGTDGGQGQKHIFTLRQASPFSIAFVLQLPESGSDTQYQLTGCQITKLDMDWTLNQPIKLTCSFTGAAFAEAAESGAPSYNLVTTGEAWHKYPSSTAGLSWTINSTTSWGNVKISFESIYADGIDESFDGSSNIRKRLERAADGPCFKVMGTAQRLFVPTAGMALFTANTTFEATYKDIAAPDGTGYHLGVNLGRCKSKPNKLVKRGQSIYDESIEFEAFVDAGTFYSTPSNDMNVTIVDKQTEPVTQ